MLWIFQPEEGQLEVDRFTFTDAVLQNFGKWVCQIAVDPFLSKALLSELLSLSGKVDQLEGNGQWLSRVSFMTLHQVVAPQPPHISSLLPITSSPTSRVNPFFCPSSSLLAGHLLQQVQHVQVEPSDEPEQTLLSHSMASETSTSSSLVVAAPLPHYGMIDQRKFTR